MNIRDIGHYDVLVAGGGPAGFCAAVAAARQGAKTAMTEKYSMAGGTLTVLGNNQIDEFINPHIKGDRMVIMGIGWEFVRRVNDLGYAGIPDQNSDRPCDNCYSIYVNPLAAAKVMDDMLLEAGVTLFYSQPLVAVETEKEDNFTRVTGGIISTKEGLGRIKADYFIDATGDGDLCAWAGNPFELGDENGNLQPGTLRYYLKGKADEEGKNRGNNILAEESKAGRLKEQDLLYGSRFSEILSSDGDNRNHVDINSASSDERTKAEIDIRRRLMVLSDAIKRADTGVSIDALAPETAPRESRRIICDKYLTQEDYISCKTEPDAVSYTHWFIDIHSQNDFMSSHIYLNDDRTPSIPISAMRPIQLSNVYVAGRCISGDRAVISAVRVKASCMAMGEACGTAAALGIQKGLSDTRNLDINLLRKTLSENGAIVPGLDRPGKFSL